ncbi:hypothetical protein DH2020_031273 [Rehmannia glutinosa]|uniref:Uncharacterized protein n=1 Tax=Rehmannia glutinosa TaxID=99300 RepID=A0ABR0VM00_REHGL
MKKLIKSQNIPISKVIKISKLKANYKPFEAKRKLCDSYDLFLVDKRVVHLLPKLIGKEFFKKKKLPLGVDLGKKNLKLQVEKALGSALFYLRSGTCCVMKVGKVAMEKDEIVENVFDAINGAVERAMPDVKLKIEGLKEIEKRSELAKNSDNEGEAKEMSGKKDGRIGKKKKKGRIHEVHYMDVGEDIENSDDDEFVGQKGMEGNMMEESDDDEGKKIEDEDLSINKNVGKKRNKAKGLKEGKKVKKKAKSEKSEVPAGLKGEKKSEFGKKSSEKIGKVKDAKRKKKSSAK